MTLHLLSAFLLALADGQDRADKMPTPQQTARSFVEALVREDFDQAAKQFDANVAKLLPADDLKDTWKQVVEKVGPLKKILGTRSEKKGSYDIVHVACEFGKQKLDVRVVLDQEGKVAGFTLTPPKGTFKFKPPPYARPEAFEEKAVTVGSGKWELPGTLSLPRGKGPFPAVVLLPGSGPQDRDETLGPNKPLRDLAWGLASRGVAALRFEKRTQTHAAKMLDIKTITVKEEVIDDALAAVALLKKTERIDPRRIFVIGHSLGGMVAPQVALLDPQVAGVVVLAGNTRPLENLILEQFEYIFSLDGGPTEAQKKKLEQLKEQVARVKSPKLTETPTKDLPLGVPAAYWLSLREADPAGTAARLKQRVLILQGERDYQVTMMDFADWKKALAGKENARLKSYPDLNHLFMTGKGKSRPDEYNKAGHVDVRVIEDIARWIKELGG
jgi:uncharacterized protein